MYVVGILISEIEDWKLIVLLSGDDSVETSIKFQGMRILVTICAPGPKICRSETKRGQGNRELGSSIVSRLFRLNLGRCTNSLTTDGSYLKITLFFRSPTHRVCNLKLSYSRMVSCHDQLEVHKQHN